MRLPTRSTWTSALRARDLAVPVLALTLLLSPRSLAAGPLAAVLGYDHYAGPQGQTTDGLVGALVLAAGAGDLTAAAVRYDDSHIARGTSITGACGLPLAPAVTLRAAGTRFLGDQEFRAWRLKAGPQFRLPAGPTLSVSFAHYQDHLGARSNGAIAEAGTPLTARLTGKASASWATAPTGPAALQGSVGLGWSPVRHLELSGEIGLTRNAAGGAGQPFPSSPTLGGLPLLGGGSGSGGSSTRDEVAGTLLLGMRVMLP